jgi:hypothetical protein
MINDSLDCEGQVCLWHIAVIGRMVNHRVSRSGKNVWFSSRHAFREAIPFICSTGRCGPSETIKNGGSLRFLVLIATGRVRRRMGWWLPRGGRVRHRSAGRVRHATRVDPGLVRRHSYVSLTC